MLFCLQSSGELQKLSREEIAYALRLDECDVTVTFQLFYKKGFCDENGHILNWNKRQFISDSSAERTKKYRKNIKEKQPYNKSVTSHNRHGDAVVTPPDTDTDKKEKDTSVSKKKDEVSSALQIKPHDKKTSNANGTRFSMDALPPDWEDWTRQHCPMLLPSKVWDKFSDYWRAQAGQKGRKLDWLATWRNWCRAEMERTNKRGEVMQEIQTQDHKNNLQPMLSIKPLLIGLLTSDNYWGKYGKLPEIGDKTRAEVAGFQREIKNRLQPSAKRYFAEQITRLSAVFPMQNRSEGALNAMIDDYYRDLQDYPADVVSAACMAYRRDPDAKWFPSPAELRARCNKAHDEMIKLHWRACKLLGLDGANELPRTERNMQMDELLASLASKHRQQGV